MDSYFWLKLKLIMWKKYFFLLPMLPMMASLAFKVFALLNPQAMEGQTPAPDPSIIEKLPYISMLEATCILIYVLPATRTYGFWLICSYLGGAICMHFLKSENFAPPLIILALFWADQFINRREQKSYLVVE
jgi:hypothetical protein